MVTHQWITSTGVLGTARTGWNCGPVDRAQLALQGIVLRENGYQCRGGSRVLPKDGAARACDAR